MKRSTKFIFSILFAITLLFSSCIRDNSPIRIGTNAWPPCEIWYVAKDKGMFRSVPVEIIRFTSWTDNMSSLYRENIDITHATYFNAVYFHDKGEPGKIILASDTIKGGDGLVVRDNLETRIGSRTAALRGKTIAVEINTDEHFLLKKAIEPFGLTEKDIVIRSMTSGEAAEAFINGLVDAAFVYEPFLSEAARRGGGTVIWTTEDLPGYMIDVLVVRDDILKTRKKEVIQIISAWYNAQAYIEENGNEVFSLMSEKEGMTAAAFKSFYNGFTFFTVEENRELFASAAFRRRLEEMNEFLFRHNAIKEKAVIEDLFTSEIVEALDE